MSNPFLNEQWSDWILVYSRRTPQKLWGAIRIWWMCQCCDWLVDTQIDLDRQSPDVMSHVQWIIEIQILGPYWLHSLVANVKTADEIWKWPVFLINYRPFFYLERAHLVWISTKFSQTNVRECHFLESKYFKANRLSCLFSFSTFWGVVGHIPNIHISTCL